MKTDCLSRACATTALFLTFLAAGPAAQAATADYLGTGTSSWSTTTNWSGGTGTGGIAGASDTAVFNGTLNAAAETITLDANQAALGIQLTTGEGAVTFSGTGTNTLTLGTGGISANGTGSGRVTFNANVVLNGDQVWNVNALTLSNVLSGTGNLTINSTGNPSLTLTPTAAGSVTGTALFSSGGGNQIGAVNGAFLNTFSGGVTVSGGAYLTFADSFTATKNFTFANGMNIYPNASNDVFSGSLFGGVGGTGATIAYQTSGNVTYNGSTDNTGLGLNTYSSASLGTNSTVLLAKTSSSSVHAINGNLGVGNYSTVQLGGSGGDQIKDTATVTMGTGSVFDLNGTSEAINVLDQASGTSTVTNTAASTTSTLTVGANNGGTTYSGVIQNGASGTGVVAFTKTGSGTTTLSGVSTYTGATSINAGTLAVSGTIGSGGGTAITVASGATLTATGSIAGASSLTTSGTTTLSGTNTYTGATAINGGTTTVTSASSLGSNSAVTLAGGSTLAFTNPGSTVTLPTSASVWQSSSDWRNTPNFLAKTIGDNSYQVGANGNGPGNAAAHYAQPDFILVDLGANYSLSQLTMTIANSFQTMQFLTANSSVGAFSSLFTLNGHSNVSPSTLNTGLFTADSATFGTGTSDYASGSQSFSLSGVSGQYFAFYITKRVNNGYGLDLRNLVLSQLGGATTQSIGSLASSDATTKVTLDGNVTLNTGGNNTSTAFAGVISGAGNLQKSGTGVQTLSGANTYTGTTTVTAGTLVISSTGTINSTSGVSIGAGEFNYSSSTALTQSVSFSGTGGKLSGSGTINSAVSVTAGNTISPGSAVSSFNGPGILSTGALSLAGTLAVDINGTTVGTNYDQLNVTGTVTLVSGNSITMSLGFSPIQGTNFFLINNDGSDSIVGLLNGYAQNAVFSLAGQSWEISYTGNSGTNSFTGGNDLVIQAVPEPATWALAAFSMTTVLVFRRRRNS